MSVKPASQRRSQEKRDRILVALEKLLQRKPFAAISVQELARGAKVSPATLYQRFDNADVMGSVLLALYFTRVEEWARRPPVGAPAPGASLEDTLQHIAGNAWDQIAALGHVIRPAYLYSRQHPERTGPDWQRLEQLALGGFRAFLQARSTALPAQDLETSAGTLAWLFNALLLAPLLHNEDARWSGPSGRKRFATTLAELAGRYLTCPR
jgi:AcrR family transcriptional regulator